jgi:hypothetical protein
MFSSGSKVQCSKVQRLDISRKRAEEMLEITAVKNQNL